MHWFLMCYLFLFFFRMGGKGDLESVLRHHEKIQEGVAEDMMNIARSLKNNSLVAKRIILSDNRV